MVDHFLLLVDESIKIELLVSDLYLLFHDTFPEDARFWWRLVEEERNHAALIRSGRDYFEPIHKFPNKLIFDNLRVLEEMNGKLRSLLDTYSKSPPDRAEALNCALLVETSAAELHFQKFLEETDTSTIEKIFQQLNGNDREHAERIRSYMMKNGVPIK